MSVEDIRRHYDEELKPELERRGEVVPPIETVREAIRAVIREQRLNEEIDRWTAGLRAKADVEEYLDSGRRELPPVVRQIPRGRTLKAPGAAGNGTGRLGLADFPADFLLKE